MGFNCFALNVMLSGPGDVQPQLELIEKVVYAWNRERAASSSVVLLPRHWSTDSVSSFTLGLDGQAEINQQLVDQADIVFAVFHSKLGTATPRAVSGTAEEIDKAIQDGLRVHVFFSEAPIPHDHDAEQYAALKQFRQSLSDRGLYRTFMTEDDLRGLVRQSLETDIAAINAEPVEATEESSRSGAQLVARYEFREVTESDRNGRVRTRKAGERIVVRNDGEQAAFNVTLRLEPVGQGDAPLLHTEDRKPPFFEVIAPHSEVSVITGLHMGVAHTQRAILQWEEGAAPQEFVHTLTL